MTLQYASDLHLEFPENRAFLQRHPLEPTGEVLLLAGDVIPFAQLHEHDAFFDYLSGHFEAVYWLPGNHEYYHSDLATRMGSFQEKIRDNVFLVNNVVCAVGPVRCIFSTLWSKISPVRAWQIKNRLSDFHRINFEGQRLSVATYNRLHDDSLAFLQAALTAGHEGPTVVVTHHVPTFLHYPAQYRGDVLNEAFATELFDLIASNGPDYWIYGHHHCNTPAFSIGKSQLLTNQLGYVDAGEHGGFSRDKTIAPEGDY